MVKYGRDKSDYDIAHIILDKDLHSAVSPGHEWDRIDNRGIREKIKFGSPKECLNLNFYGMQAILIWAI